jgi:hypothetical protein
MGPEPAPVSGPLAPPSRLSHASRSRNSSGVARSGGIRDASSVRICTVFGIGQEVQSAVERL